MSAPVGAASSLAPGAVDFQALFEAAPNAYMVVDPALRYVAANRAYLALVGARLEDLLGRTPFDVFPNDPDDPNNASVVLVRESLLRALRERRPDSLALLPYRVSRGASVHPDEVRYWSATHTPLLDARGEVAFVLQHTMDVTELARREASGADVPSPGPGALAGTAAEVQDRASVLLRARVVQEAHRRLADVLEQAPVAISIYRGPRFVIELANEAMCRLLSRARDELLGRPLFEAVPETAGQGFEERLAAVRATGEPFVGTGLPVRLVHPETGTAEQAYVDFVYAGLSEPDGTTDSVIVVATDVTERVRARQRADALREIAEDGIRLRDEFLSVASHELRTPLTALTLRLARLQALVADGPEEPTLSRQLALAGRQVQRLGALLNGLFDVSRLSTGRLDLAPESLELVALVREVVTAYEPEAAQVGSAVSLEAAGAIHVRADRLRLEQVLTNLLSNALRYGRGRPVRVQVRAEGPRALVRVADEGIGIDPGARERIFEKFERAAPDRHPGGLGLGLYLARQIVEALGGTVEVESTPGVGSAFTVMLPREDRPDGRPAAP